MTNHIWFRFFAFNSFPCGSSISFDFSYLIDGTLSLPRSMCATKWVNSYLWNVERRKLFPFYSFRLYGERDGKHKSLPLGAPSQKWNWWLCSTEFVAADECVRVIYISALVCVCQSLVSVKPKSVDSASKVRRQNFRRRSISIVEFDRWRCAQMMNTYGFNLALVCHFGVLADTPAILCRHNVCAIQLFVCRSYPIFLCAKLVFHHSMQTHGNFHRNVTNRCHSI